VTSTPLIALTGTASKIVLKDVQRELGITAFDSIITPKTFDRKELHYYVLYCKSREKSERLIEFLNQLPNEFEISKASFLNLPASLPHLVSYFVDMLTMNLV